MRDNACQVLVVGRDDRGWAASYGPTTFERSWPKSLTMYQNIAIFLAVGVVLRCWKIWPDSTSARS